MSGSPRMALVLLDADQLDVRSVRGEPDLVLDRDPDGPVVVVVFTTNARSKVIVQADRDFVFRTATNVAIGVARLFEPAVDPSDVRHEIALTLCMPEAADRAVLRLLRETPTEANSGPFDDVVLLSGDRKLQTAVTTIVGGTPRWRPADRPRVCGLPVQVWQLGRRRTHLRAWHASRPEPGCGPARADDSPTLVIDSDARARQAEKVLVQVGGGLRSIAYDVEENPSHLTQVGLTLQSAVGVTRLSAALDKRRGMQLIGSCRPGDGLELTHLAQRGPTISPDQVSVAESSVGPGAVRLEWDEPRRTRTVRTRLPFELLANVLPQARASTLVRPHRSLLNDEAVLGIAKGLRWRPTSSVTVEFAGGIDSRQLSCKIDWTDDGYLSTWWRYLSNDAPRTTSHLDLDWPSFARPPRLKGRINAVAAIDTSGTELILTSTATTAEVAVQRLVEKNTLGTATVAASGIRCAVLALGKPIVPGRPVHCTRIQAFTEDELTRAARLPEHRQCEWWALMQMVRRLPILVPTHRLPASRAAS